MSLVLVLLVVLTAPLAVSHFVKASFAVVLPSTLFGMTLLLYLFGLANVLEIGFVVILSLVGALGVAALVRLRPRRWWPALQASLTPALVVFVAIVVATFALTRGMHLANWDEFSEWGAVVKATFLEDSLSPYNSIELLFQSYPPGLSLFEYMVMKVGGGWNEANLFWAYQLLFGSLFIPFLAKVQWRQSARLLLILPIFGLGTIALFNPFQAILVDPFLGLLSGYCLAIVYAGNARSRILAVQLGLAVAMLVLTKDSGAFFAALAIALYLWKLLREFRPGRSRVAWLDLGTRFAVPLGVAFAASLSWKIVLALQHVPLIFSSPINFGELGGLFDGTGRPYWQPLIHVFGRAVVNTPINSVHGFGISHRTWFGIAFLAVIALEFSRRRGDRETRNLAAPVIVLGGAVVYTVGLLILYMFKFTENEAVSLASFGRYLGTYWVAVMMFVSLAVASRVVGDEKLLFVPRKVTCTSASFRLGVGWLIALLVLAPVVDFASFLRHPVSGAMQARSNYEPVLAAAARAGITGDDRVWIIVQQTAGYEYWILRYDLMPMYVNPGAWSQGSWSLGTPLNEGDIWTWSATPAEWASRLSAYDYVLVYKSSSTLTAQYGSMFEDPSTVADGTIFKVIKRDGKIKLEFMEAAQHPG